MLNFHNLALTARYIRFRANSDKFLSKFADETSLCKRGTNGISLDIAVLIHAHYLDELEKISAGLSGLESRFSRIIVSCTNSNAYGLALALSWPSQNTLVTLEKNRGRNIGTLLRWCQEITEPVMLHLHTKQSPHASSYGFEWFREIGLDLLDESLLETSNKLLISGKASIAYAAPSQLRAHSFSWGANSKLLRRSGYRKTRGNLGYPLFFPLGAMFLIRSDELKKLKQDFESVELPDSDIVPLDGSVLHLFERLIGATQSKHLIFNVATAPKRAFLLEQSPQVVSFEAR